MLFSCFVDSICANIYVYILQVFGSLLWDRLVTLVFAPDIIIIGHRDAWRALPSLRGLAHTLSLVVYWLVALTLWATLDSIFVPIGAYYFWAKSPLMLRWRGVELPAVMALPPTATAATAPTTTNTTTTTTTTTTTMSASKNK